MNWEDMEPGECEGDVHKAGSESIDMSPKD